MLRTAQAALWLGIVFAVTAAMHFYFWRRLIHDTFLPQPFKGILGSVTIALAISFPLPFFANRYFAPPWRDICLWTGFIWMGTAFVLLVALLAAEIPRLAINYAYSDDSGRRIRAARFISVAAVVTAFALVAHAVRTATAPPIIQRVRVELARWPQALSGFTIAQVSDLHAGVIIGRSVVEAVVSRVNGLGADLIVLTGDIVDGGAACHSPTVEPLGELSAVAGVYFVTGNHEFYSGADEWVRHFRELGIRVLRNERVEIGDGEDVFYLAGVDDPTGMRFGGRGVDVGRALSGRDPRREVILLAHNPNVVRAAAKHGVGLQISGHTHGGQIRPFDLLVRIHHAHVSGLFRKGSTQLYVNPGTGFWGPPMRLGTRSEITLFEIFPGT